MSETAVIDRPSRIERLHRWREENISDRLFVIVVAFVVGVLSAVAAFVLHWLIREIETLLTGKFHTSGANWLYLVFPIVGIFLTSLFVRYVVKDNISHGITRILYAISSKQSRLKGHNCWSSVISSAITIGFGGSVGAEAPIVLTGSAIGSNIGQLFHMSNRQLMVLLGCGASAAIAGIYKAPIAGLVFTLEVLMIDLTMASLLPILVACVTATCFTYVFVGDASILTFHIDNPWSVRRVPACIMLGIACGLVSLYFIRTMTACEDVFARFRDRPVVKLIIGGITLSMLIFLFPTLYGEGYDSINLLLRGDNETDWSQLMGGSLFSGSTSMLMPYIALVILTKVFATSATNGGGGVGGTFAPSLFIGCFFGFFFARLWNMEHFGVYLPEKNFALMGMAGVISGVMHAPLTGIFLIAEITGGYSLFLPLIIVSVSAYLTIIIFEPHSIYGMRLAKQGKLITHHTDRSILTLMSLDSVIDREYTAVSPDMELGRLVHKISDSHAGILPVLDGAGTLIGEIDLQKIRHIVFRIELYHHFTASQLMIPPPAMLSDKEPMTDVMRTFEMTQANQLPVVDKNDRLIGYISRQRLYVMYRKMVADNSTE